MKIEDLKKLTTKELSDRLNDLVVEFENIHEVWDSARIFVDRYKK